ncbi:MAG: SDR family NAD(P)-dependent oxidoreductase [bacterium]|nr:SDR family NAD(P)-dependent oxidoreductase [bacterium]
MKNTQLTALVTGAVKGIGKAITYKLIHEGYFVIMVDVDKAAGLELESENKGLCVFRSCNISKEAEVKEVFSFIAGTYGNLDLLVNNAGIIKDNLIWNMAAEDFDSVVDINLKGTWLMCKEAAGLMKNQQKGRIVNIASRAWLGNKGQSNYSASKAGIIGLTRVLALELGKYNVCVNAIAPGLIDTPLTRGLRKDVLEGLIAAQPTKSIGQPSDIANAVAFLGSYSTGFITGQTLYVDGGKSIGSNLSS